MSDNVIPFRRKPLDDSEGVLRSDGTLMTECDEHVHVYASVPGRCQCGKSCRAHFLGHLGDGTLQVEFDMTPLLKTEKPKRKWPDDFRGFLSNVRPRKQK